MNRWESIKGLVSNLPIGLCAICVGACTLGNIFIMMGLSYIKYAAVMISVLVVLGMIAKVMVSPEVVWNELKTAHVGCFYPTFSMLLMVLGSHFLNYNFMLGRSLWLIGILINMIVIGIFAYHHIIARFDLKAVTPGWFVGFVGILVAGVTSPGMEAPHLVKGIFFFALTNYIILLPIVLYRVISSPVEDNIYPSLAIFPAPPSLCLVTYLTIFDQPNLVVASIFFVMIQLSLAVVYLKLNHFFRLKFSPTFASLTFPLAISCLALFKYSGYLQQLGFTTMAGMLEEFGGLELLIASAVISTVIYRIYHLLKCEHKKRKGSTQLCSETAIGCH